MAGRRFGHSYADYNVLLEENIQLHKDKSSLLKDLDQCYSTLNRYECENDYSETDHWDCEQEIRQLKAEIQKYKHEIQQKERKCQFLQRENFRQIQDLEEECDDILISKQEKIRNLEKEVNNLHLDNKLLKVKLGNTKHSYTKKLNNYMKEKELEIYQLHDQLQAAVIYSEDKTTELKETRIERDFQLNLQNQIVHNLKKDVESRDLTINSLKKVIDNIKIKSFDRQELRKSPIERSDQSSVMRDQLRQALTKVKEIETELKQTNFEKDRKLSTNRDLKRKVEKDENRIRKLEGENNKTISAQKQRIKFLERELEGQNLKLKRLEELKEEQLTRRIKESEKARGKIISSQEQKMQHLKRELERRSQEIITLEEALANTRKKVDDTNELERDLKEKDAQLAKLRDQLEQTLAKLKISEENLEREFERGFDQFSSQNANLKIRKDSAAKVDFENTNEQIILSLKQKVQRLQGEIEQRDKKVNCLEIAVENSNVEAEKESKLIKDLKKREDLLSEQRNQLQNAVTKLKETQAQLLKITSERDNERHTRLDLERKAQENQTRIRELKQVNDEIILPQKKRIQNLEREIEIRDLKENRQEEIVESRKTEAMNEREIIRNLKKREDQLQQALTKLKQAEAKLNETTSERDIERHKRQRLEGTAKENEAKTKEQEQVNGEIAIQQKQRIQYLEREVKRRDMKLKDLEEMLDKTKAEFKSEKELGKMLRKKDDRLTELEYQLEQILVKLKKTETELEETKTRLSKAMGDRLTDNNPNIANLSDKNRPVKLAERYAELYDNQWTDAFDILEKHFDTEQYTIEALLEILQNVMRFCIARGSKQMEDLQSVLGFSDTYGGDVPTDVRKHLKDSRKAMSSIPVRNLYKMYISHLKRSVPQTLERTLEVSSFVQECLEICWLMVIQDPPVVFAPVAKSGSALNTDIFKPYTRTGTHVEFTVWPALLLHEGGPVLAKGVAQGYGKKSSSANVSQ